MGKNTERLLTALFIFVVGIGNGWLTGSVVTKNNIADSCKANGTAKLADGKVITCSVKDE